MDAPWLLQAKSHPSDFIVTLREETQRAHVIETTSLPLTQRCFKVVCLGSKVVGLLGSKVVCMLGSKTHLYRLAIFGANWARPLSGNPICRLLIYQWPKY